MHESDDKTLLREYAEGGSQEAFATLVTRHVNKVYSVALRHACNPIQAEEITQSVFVILAQKARKIGKKVILSGWLYQTTRLTAITFIRSEIRRARREQEARSQSVLNETETDAWPQIAPLLDAAMARLNETDRHALVLRFFDCKSMKEVGDALGASEGATKMRVARALEKLRAYFFKRGVVVSAATLTAMISANSVHATPAALATTATAAALTKAVAAPTSTPALVKGSLKLFAWANAKTAVIISATVLAVGTSAVVIQSQFKAGADFSASTWSDAGYGDPGSAVKTLMWAISRNDAKAILASVSPACQAEFQELAAQSKPAMTMEQFLLQKWGDKIRHVSEFRVLKSDVLSDGDIWLNLSRKIIDGGSGSQWIGLKKIEGQWKLDDFDLKSNVNGRAGWPCLSPKYGGVGVKLRTDEKTREVLIKEVVSDSPAARAGLSPGLVVKTINGVSTAKKTAAECVFLTRGLVDRTVWLVLVNREQGKTHTIELDRKFAVY